MWLFIDFIIPQLATASYNLTQPATMLTRFLAASSALALLAASQVDAHGHLVDPVADFGENKGMMSSFAGRIPDPHVIFPGSNFPASGTKGNYNEFMKHFKNGTQSLKEIIAANNKPLPGATKDCGFTVLGAGRTVPDALLWGKNEGKASSEGFRPTHWGACETYCDDTLVQKSDECATAYNQPDNKGQAKIPIDASKCAGAKQLTFLWLTTQAKDEGGFQVYSNCVALSGSGSGADSGGSSAATPAPAAGDSDADGDNDAPATTTAPSSDDEGSASDSTPTSKTPKTKKPKKTKTPKTKKPKKTKKPSADEDEASDKSSGSDYN